LHPDAAKTTAQRTWLHVASATWNATTTIKEDDMYAARLLFLLSITFLGACSTVDPRLNTQQSVLDGKLQRLLADYNARHHTHVEVPVLKIEDNTDQPGKIAEADYSTWSISVNGLWLKKDPCIVYKEAVAHELAHLLVYYQQFGAPRAATMLTRTGPVVVAFNGPAELQDSSLEHGKVWQDMALELGAHPCEEGYCRSAHPYSKSPLTCSAADYALLQATPPSATPKAVPSTTVPRSTPTGNGYASAGRIIYDSQVH
jgi:hypothetical protein